MLFDQSVCIGSPVVMKGRKMVELAGRVETLEREAGSSN